MWGQPLDIACRFLWQWHPRPCYRYLSSACSRPIGSWVVLSGRHGKGRREGKANGKKLTYYFLHHSAATPSHRPHLETKIPWLQLSLSIRQYLPPNIGFQPKHSFMHKVPSSNKVGMFAQHGESGNGMDTADNVWRSPEKRIRARQIGHIRTQLTHILRQHRGYFLSNR